MSEEDHQARLMHIESKVDDIDKKVDQLDKDMARYRGLVGGLLLAASAVTAFLKLAWDKVKEL